MWPDSLLIVLLHGMHNILAESGNGPSYHVGNYYDSYKVSWPYNNKTKVSCTAKVHHQSRKQTAVTSL